VFSVKVKVDQNKTSFPSYLQKLRRIMKLPNKDMAQVAKSKTDVIIKDHSLGVETLLLKVLFSSHEIVEQQFSTVCVGSMFYLLQPTWTLICKFFCHSVVCRLDPCV